MSAGRADRVVDRLRELELDVLLVTDLVDLRWLTGFTGTNGAAVVGPDERLFLTDFRYTEQAAAQVGDGFEIVRAGRDLLGELTARLPSGRAGFDDERVTVRAHARLAERAGATVDLIPAGGLLRRLREVKDADELKRIAAAAELATTAFEKVVESGLAGRTERALALELEHEMRLAGAEDPAFPSIVAAGAHGALPHAEPRDAEIPAGVLVTVDWGARLDGYCSDCTRTLASGPVDERAREIYELVLRAQEAALAAVEPGAALAAVDGVAREIVVAAGHGERFGHGLGHGVGLEVHEGPRLAHGAAGTLAADSVVTVEPGVYLPGELGVRIEDLVVVDAAGPRVLTGFTKALTEV
ncbi:MAG TPA: Xaa-Pro peptidase family protein [Solirubrobacteraceae bacterium]|nr:Xaa-Pro peptidase family protein [Solirubrobacteraceae bacterium]